MKTHAKGRIQSPEYPHRRPRPLGLGVHEFPAGPSRFPQRGRVQNLRYFTVLSNLMQAGVSLAYVLGGRPRRLKYASTVSVGLTFFVVLLFLGRLYGYAPMYSGANFWFHLVVPILAMADFLCLDREGGYTLRDSLMSLIPSLCYGLFYVGNLLINGVKGNDWYGFARGGPGSAAVVFLAILAGRRCFS